MEQLSLKRSQFTKSIRANDIQQRKKKIRYSLSFIKKTNDYTYDLQWSQFDDLHQKLTNNNYKLSNAEVMIDYLNLCAPNSITNPTVVKILTQIMKKYKNISEINQKIYQMIGKILALSINATNLSNDEGINCCFYQIAQLLSYSDKLLKLWKLFSQIKQPTILRAIALMFNLQIECIDEITPQTVTFILEVYSNFSNNHPQCFQFNTYLKIILKIQLIFEEYDMSDLNLQQAIHVLEECIRHQDTQYRIAYLAEEHIFTSILQYLSQQKIKLLSQETVIAILRLCGRIYAVQNSKTCCSIYSKSLSLIQWLRNILPIPVKIKNGSQNCKKVLIHKRFQVIRSVLFVLGNIAGSGKCFVQIYLTSDIYECLQYLYDLMPHEICLQISIIIYNMVSLAGIDNLEVMYQNNLLNLLEMMISSQHQSCIQEKGIIILKKIILKLTDFQHEARSNWNLTLDKLKINCQTTNIQKYIQKLLYTENEKLSCTIQLLLNFLHE